MRILIIDDGTITAGVLKQHLEKQFNSGISVAALEKRDVSSDEATGVQEFYGSVKELKPKLAGADVLVVHKAPVTGEIIDAVAGLKLIACARGGPVNVDLEAATKKGIPVAYTPGRAAMAAADLTIGLMLALARNITWADSRVKNLGAKAWDYAVRSSFEGIELYGKNLGVIGFGQVGREVALRARAFGMNVLVYSSHVENYFNVKTVSLRELLVGSDFVTLHKRFTPRDAGMIGKNELSLMKESAFLINTARGKFIDEKALYDALKKGKIKGAALDVLEEEPPRRDNPLFTLKNIIITPHIGGKTHEVPLRAAQMIGEEIMRFLRGEGLLNIANPEVLGP